MKKFFTLILAVLSVTGLAFAKKAEGPARISVISFNVRYGDAKDGTNSWPLRCSADVEMVNDQMPDVMGVQEALDYQLKFIKEYTKGYNWVGVGRDDAKHKGEHMSIFYNKKVVSLVKWGNWYLSETPDKISKGWDARHPRTATWALFKDKRSGKKFFYVNTHLDHIGVVARSEGLKLVQKLIADMNPNGWPLILSGDFNIEPDNEAIAQLDKTMKSARDVAAKTDRHGSFNGWGKADKIIDYIYFTGFRRCESFETITKRYQDRTFLSDHYPIKAVLEF